MTIKFCLISLLLILLSPSHAGDLNTAYLKQYADLNIFYSAFPSTFISPSIADSNQIIQRRNVGIVNIVGLEGNDDHVPLTIQGTVVNIFQQKQLLQFYMLQEGDALYHLASFNFENEDFLTFTILIKPQSAKKIHQIKFQKVMYID